MIPEFSAKFAAAQKEYLARYYSRMRPVYLVNEFPKSGGTWLKFMLGEALSLPVWTKGNMTWESCVMQAHWLRPRGRCRTIALFRDGRDVMVSFYFHCFFLNEFQNAALVALMRRKFAFQDYHDVKANLLPFMKSIHASQLTPGFSWKGFVDAWASRPDSVRVRYEDLRANAGGKLARLVFELTGHLPELQETEAIAERFTMDRMRERKAELSPSGTQKAEVSFIRKGSVGGWSEHFTEEALDWFEREHKDQLAALGYPLRGPGGD